MDDKRQSRGAPSSSVHTPLDRKFSRNLCSGGPKSARARAWSAKAAALRAESGSGGGKRERGTEERGEAADGGRVEATRRGVVGRKHRRVALRTGGLGGRGVDAVVLWPRPLSPHETKRVALGSDFRGRVGVRGAVRWGVGWGWLAVGLALDRFGVELDSPPAAAAPRYFQPFSACFCLAHGRFRCVFSRRWVRTWRRRAAEPVGPVACPGPLVVVVPYVSVTRGKV